MCGICGMAARDPRSTPIGVPALRAMTGAIIHRGPDDDGHHTEPGVALGMRRLSIIDVEGSPQPVTSEDGGRAGRLQRRDLQLPRAARRARRHAATASRRTATRRRSSTSTRSRGPDFVKRLRGMFAIALWDRPRRRLVLARDRMGVKPLYWAETPNGLAFASEVKSLIAGGVIQPELDPMAAELFLAHGFVPGPRTPVRGRAQAAAGLAAGLRGRPGGRGAGVVDSLRRGRTRSPCELGGASGGAAAS